MKHAKFDLRSQKEKGRDELVEFAITVAIGTIMFSLLLLWAI